MAIFGRPCRYAERKVKLVREVFEVVIYFGEMVVAPLFAVFLFETSTLSLGNAVILASAGIVAWTLAEYAFHRFVLHRLVPTQHRMHHANPDKPVLSIFWQIWVCFAVVYLVAGGAVLAGSLIAYAWYLFVHHCTHHSAHSLPAFLIRNHNGHHKFATRNFGVTTTLWDNMFGTALRQASSVD
jgi:sterol desaturase/sphingolipid hydroxylase (fatty acid hydroxylase superfamily)